MCGFAVVPKGLSFNDRFLKRRGPDTHTVLTCEKFDFHHYLLHITGDFTPQPFHQDGIVCVYNGEIYNQPFSKSDGEVLIPLYLEYGETFTQQLDGEFAIALYDFRKGKAIFSTDAFGTKPLFVCGDYASTYQSALGGKALAPNTTLVKKLNSALSKTTPVCAFDFSNQHKNHFEDWKRAFSQSISKRATEHCFIGLSSGYDSGAIACELLNQDVPFKAFMIRGGEDLNVLLKRRELTNAELISLSENDYSSHQKFLSLYCEPCRYNEVSSIPLHCDDMFDDCGAMGLSVICQYGTRNGARVCLSGQGADEILADYALKPEVSHFKGSFPDILTEWPNFYGNCQRAYLLKEELVGGCYGVETRYPFLDKALVQEFLWLSPSLKNLRYKAPLADYLEQHTFPYVKDWKMGFAAHLNLKESSSQQRISL